MYEWQFYTFISILYFSSDNFKCNDGRTDDTLNLKKKSNIQFSGAEAELTI